MDYLSGYPTYDADTDITKSFLPTHPASSLPPARIACWNDGKPNAVESMIGLVCIIIGFLLGAVALSAMGGKEADDRAATAVAGFFSLAFLGGGAACLFYRQLKGKLGIEVTDSGIEFLTPRQSTKFGWDEIHKVTTREAGESDGKVQYIVRIEPRKGSAKSFETHIGGDPHGVMKALLERCDYIVRSPLGEM